MVFCVLVIREFDLVYFRREKDRPLDHNKRSTSPYSKSRKHKTHHKTKRHHKPKRHHKKARKESDSDSDRDSGSASNVDSHAGSDVAYPVPHMAVPRPPLISYSDNSRASTPCVRTPTGPGATTPTIRDVLTPEHVQHVQHVQHVDKEKSPAQTKDPQPETNGETSGSFHHLFQKICCLKIAHRCYL